jgi:MFS family permease
VSRVSRLIRTTFDSLRIRNYRLYFIGQVISVSGSWMQRVAQAWLVLHLSGGGLALGLVTGLQFLPVLLAGPWGGLLADRVDKRRLLLWTQAGMGMLALVLGLLTISGLVHLWMLYGLALALGCLTAVDNPARQAFVMEMVGRQNLVLAEAVARYSRRAFRTSAAGAAKQQGPGRRCRPGPQGVVSA